MRAILASCVLVVSIAACGPSRTGGGDDDDSGGKMDACVGLECQVVNCAAMGMPDTSVSGTVFAPNGTLPLWGITVYVPRMDPGPLVDGVICDQCSTDLPGSAVVQTKTDEAGKFSLSGIPAGDNVQLVITSGKWRRIVPLPTVPQCADMPVDPTLSRLPKNKTEGDIPKIAVTTGNADSLECLIPRLGIDLAEITSPTGGGRIHLYNGNGVNQITGGGNLPAATTLWNDVSTMKPYDIVIFSCEGQQNANTKSQAAMDAVKAYADLGGRVFLSHWHNIWVGGPFNDNNNNGQMPKVWTSIANWTNNDGFTDPDTIDETGNPNGMSFATWMVNVMGSATRDVVQIAGGTGRNTCTTIDNTKAERWVYFTGNGNQQMVQNFQFTTPNESDPSTRCGKVVFSDMHVSGGPTGGTYPASCGGNLTTLSAQEKALAFMFFDIASCVSVIF
jgi:hypothetical protein